MYPGSMETQIKPTLRRSTSYAHVKEQFKQISRIPSPFNLPARDEEAEFAESSSVATPATTITEPISEAATAASSLLSFPQIFSAQGSHFSPSMPMEESVKAIWARQIRSRFSTLLLHHIPKGTCVQEFMMAGRRPDALKPTLIVTCGDARTKKKVEKTLKNQTWLQKLLKVNNIMFLALVAETPLSAGPVSGIRCTTKLSESSAVLIAQFGATTSCGMGLLISDADNYSQQRCTLGGLLMVNGRLMGLTAGHAFLNINHKIAARELPEATQDVEDFSDEESSSISADPFIFNGSDDVDVADTIASGIFLHENFDIVSTSANGHGQNGGLTPPPAPMEWICPQAAILPTTNPTHASPTEVPLNGHDWALLEELPSAVISMPNKIASFDQDHDILINETIRGPIWGEVTIATASIGPQQGILHSSPATMKVDENVLEVQLITMERFLPLGTSGAWVVSGGKLCGYIIAIRQDIPWAYMVAIEPVFEDIRRRLDTEEVRLPFANELGSHKDLSIPSLAKSSNEREQEQLRPTSEEVHTRIADEWKKSPLATRPRELSSMVEMGMQSSVNELVPELSGGHELPLHWLLSQKEYEPLNEKVSIQGDARLTSAIDLEHGSHPIREALETGGSADRVWQHRDPPTAPSAGHGLKSAYTVASLVFGSVLFHLPRFFWRRVETSILHTEYRRRRRGRVLSRFSPRLLSIPIVSLPRYPADAFIENPKNVRVAISNDARIFWYYIQIPLTTIFGCVLTFLYFTVCFPFILWVAHRHAFVLVDYRDARLGESFEMLGPWPERYRDHGLMDIVQGIRYVNDQGRPIGVIESSGGIMPRGMV
ncbi:MAG: hypothetical protein Q9170_003715 [Blastenia crenularia]